MMFLIFQDENILTFLIAQFRFHELGLYTEFCKISSTTHGTIRIKISSWNSVSYNLEPKSTCRQANGDNDDDTKTS